ncbi:MAG TPA: TetR/AcrR family transcriptional regulator [Acidimicrobiales bacterium]|jgi:AcrR family transcriptional regulator|nr:TetR/AcrR family transcriptional regulator [Acidimicrobiales bacterium]
MTAPDTPVPLPPGLDILWGRRPAGRRGPRPGLSVESIVSAAVAVADRDGLESLSMARVAAEVGFTTMSLYRYVANKDELLQLMWDASAEGAEELVIEGDTWRDRLRTWSGIQRDVLAQHPWLTQMPMAAPPMAPNSLTFVERGLETMDGTGLADVDKLRIIGLISSYTLSEARMANDAARARPEGVESPSFESFLRLLLDEERFPRLYGIAWSEPSSPRSDHEDFLFGLDRILDGVAALIGDR